MPILEHPTGAAPIASSSTSIQLMILQQFMNYTVSIRAIMKWDVVKPLDFHILLSLFLPPQFSISANILAGSGVYHRSSVEINWKSTFNSYFNVINYLTCTHFYCKNTLALGPISLNTW